MHGVLNLTGACIIPLWIAIVVIAAPQNIPISVPTELRAKTDGYVDVNAYLQELNVYTARWARPDPTHPKLSKTRRSSSSEVSRPLSHTHREQGSTKRRRHNADDRVHVPLVTADLASVQNSRFYGTLTVGGQDTTAFFVSFDTVNSGWLLHLFRHTHQTQRCS